MRVVATVLAALPVLAAGTLGCRESPDSSPTAGDAVIRATVDGDTLIARIGGHDETVRLLGIDTPETKHPDKPVECFGPEASARLAQLVPPGTRVRLARDAEARDRFGRLLAYVTRLDGVLVNEALAREGFARPLAIRPNTALSSRITAAAARARDDRAGLWGACPRDEGSR